MIFRNKTKQNTFRIRNHKFYLTGIISSIIFFGIFGLAKSSRAACTGSSPTWTSTVDRTSAASCISQAVDGDTVNITGGSAIWSTPIVWTDKNITVAGAGDTTAITATNQAFYVNCNTRGKCGFRITAMKLLGATSDVAIQIVSNSASWVKGFRVDHITFDHSGSNTAVKINSVVWGLVDHCTFLNTANTGGYNAVDVSGESNNDARLNGLNGDTYFLNSLNLGTDEAVYVEDNTITFNTESSAAINAGRGGSFVFRHNTVNGTMVQTHSTNANNRGSMKFEIYNNNIDGTCAGCSSSKFLWPIYLRSGTGVIFNNYIHNYRNFFAVLDNPRSYTSEGGPLYLCAGATGQSGCAYDGCLGTDNQAGWPCLDQIGWTGNSPGSQTNNPLYLWNNGSQSTCQSGTTCSNDTSIYINNSGQGAHPQTNDHIKTTSDTDFHPGKVVDYVNNGTMPKTGYTPYTYPHPLQSVTPVPPPTTYNITNFTQLVSDWLKNISNSPADVNTDGSVNAKDLGIMMSKWKE